jgi:beta-barrel assembly-enhancing protease
VGAIVPVLGAARFSLSARLWTSLPALLFVAFSLPAFSVAQTADQNANAAQPASSEVSQTTPPTTEQDSPVNPASPAVAASQVPTAAQIETAAQQDNSEEPDAQKTQLASQPAVQNTQPSGANQEGPLPAKYDVSQIGRRNVGTGLDFYSLDREIALGRQLSNEVEMSARLVTDPIVNEYINRIGQNLVRNSDARVPFTIKILDTDEVNAFALPGGFFYVNSGLILAADDEAELAGVMAHEIAHVAARHATKNMTRAQIWNMASLPLIFIGGPVAYAISEVASIAVPMTYLKFSRDAEREADLLGLEYDYAAGYDPHAFVEFFEKLNLDGKKKHSALAKAFASHPMNADRIKAAQEEIRKYLPDRPEYVVDTSEFENVKTRLISLENGRRLGGAKGGDGNRPVLLRRTSSSSSSSGDSTQSSTQDGNSTPDPKDDGRPTLKRNPSD